MRKLPQLLILLGIILIISSLALFLFIFIPVAKVELDYSLGSKTNTKEITPIDKEFGIVIPKIRANAKIIKDVDPYNANIYQIALTKGIAHAKGTVMPGEIGNMFLFSHSSVNILEASRYNSIFYLLSKLEKNDEVYIFYKDAKHTYKVSEIKIVDAKDVSYLSGKSDKKTLTLMTCWPAGTSYKRLLVIAKEL